MPDEAIQIQGLSLLQVFHGRCINYFQHTVFCAEREQTLIKPTFVPGQLPLPHRTSPLVCALWKQGLSYVPDVHRAPRITVTTIKTVLLPLV